MQMVETHCAETGCTLFTHVAINIFASGNVRFEVQVSL
jgi:hypothetical protein